MKIGFHKGSEAYTTVLLERLTQRLSGDQMVEWRREDGSAVADIEVLLTLGAVTREMMADLPKLVLIQTLSDGYEKVDMAAATEMGIGISFAPGDLTGNADSVAEYAVLLLLAAARRLGVALASIGGSGVAKPGPSPVMVQKTVCIVGPGSIGEEIAQRLQPFGVRLTGVARDPLHAPKIIATRPLAQLKEAVGEADFVVICLRATADNERMIDAGVLASMKQGAVLVNIARGSLIDEAALCDAVRSGHLGGAGLDVVEQEPIAKDNPLLSLPQIFVTPHVAGQTDLTIEGTVEYVAEVIAKLKAGQKIASLLNDPERPRKLE